VETEIPYSPKSHQLRPSFQDGVSCAARNHSLAKPRSGIAKLHTLKISPEQGSSDGNTREDQLDPTCKANQFSVAEPQGKTRPPTGKSNSSHHTDESKPPHDGNGNRGAYPPRPSAPGNALSAISSEEQAMTHARFLAPHDVPSPPVPDKAATRPHEDSSKV